MSRIAVNYVVQNDPWDNISEPNLFFLPGTHQDLNKITAKLIYDSFPIKKQKFFLRFYLFDKIENLKLWMDLPPNATVPIYTDKVFVKALRLPNNADDIKFTTDKLFEKKNVNKKEEGFFDNIKVPQKEEVKQQSSISPNKIPDNNKKSTKNDNNIIIDNDLIENLTKNLGTNQSNSQDNKREKEIKKSNNNEEFSGFEFGNSENPSDKNKNKNINADPYDIFSSSQPQQYGDNKQDNKAPFNCKLY